MNDRTPTEIEAMRTAVEFDRRLALLVAELNKGKRAVYAAPVLVKVDSFRFQGIPEVVVEADVKAGSVEGIALKGARFRRHNGSFRRGFPTPELAVDALTYLSRRGLRIRHDIRHEVVLAAIVEKADETAVRSAIEAYAAVAGEAFLGSDEDHDEF